MTVVGIGSMCWHVACVSFATVSVGAARMQTSNTNKMAEMGESNLSLQKKKEIKKFYDYATLFEKLQSEENDTIFSGADHHGFWSPTGSCWGPLNPGSRFC